MAEYHPMRKPDYFYQEVARKLGLDYRLVRDVNKWYWSQGIRKNISQAAHRSLYIKHLGTVTMSRRKLYAAIYKTVRVLRSLRRMPEGTRRTEMVASYEQQLRQLLQQRNQWALENYKKQNHV